MAAVYQCPSPEALQRLVENGGPAEEIEGLAQHLEKCETCGKVLEAVLAANPTVSGLRSPTIGELPTGKLLEELKERLRRLQPAADLGQARASIRFACPHCNKDLKCKPELAGKKVKCPGCGKPAAVPGKRSDAPPADINDGKTLMPAGDRAGRTMPPATDRSEPERDQTLADPTRQEHEVWDFLAPPDQPGDLGRLGPYRILKVLGAGGMGVVFRAFDPHLERLVALKAMLPSLAASPSAKQRFFREAKAAAALKHPNVVSIFQVGEDRGAPFLAMEFLEGEPLDECLKRQGKLPVTEVLDIGRQIALGLSAAHEKGLIHRDIKPANVWLETNDERGMMNDERKTEAKESSRSSFITHRSSFQHVKILDFGLARAMGDQSHLTQSGAIVGTPAYMAPEQAAGKEVDHRCDLFSLGCVLYRMCTGQMAFKGRDTISVLSSLALDDPASPADVDPAIPAELSELVMELLAKEPSGRPTSAREVAGRLQELQEQTRSGAPAGKVRRRATRGGKRGRVLVAAACVALLLGGLIAAAVVLRFGTGDGELVVEIQDPNIEVAVKQDNLIVSDKTTKREFTLKAKNGEVEVFEKDGVRLLTRKFELTRGGKTTITVTADELAAARQGGEAVAHWVERKWIEEVSQFPAKEQVRAVCAKLQERNPGYDGKADARMDGDRVVEFKVVTDKVFELSPLRVFTGLRKLEYPYRSWLWAEPLRSMKALETINGQPAAAFWKTVDADAAEFEKFCKFVALLPAADQVKEVTARLKTQNPGFTATPTSTIDQGTGMVKEIAFPTEHLIDLSAVRALPRLQSLNLSSDSEKTKLVHLAPLHAMKLTSLILAGCGQVRDLTPLQGMPLNSLYLGACNQVRDLTPLKGMPLTSLVVSVTQVRDLTPLQGMKLTSLILSYCPQVRNLTPLRGMKLTSLALCGQAELSDLDLLQGMELTYLDLSNCNQVRDLKPLQGMPLTSLYLRCTQVRDLTPLKGMKLQTLDASDTGVQDLTPLADMPLETLVFTPKNITRGIEVIQRMTTLKKISASANHPPITSAEFWKKYQAGEFGKPAESGPVHLPHWVERKWIEEVSQLPADQQVGVVRTKLQERNPGFDGKDVSYHIDDGRVVEFAVQTDKVFELSPLRAFTGLRKLDCRPSGHGRSILQDLSPLQGLPLTVLILHDCTQVYDLSPLRGMKLVELSCTSTAVTNLKPLVGQPLRALHFRYHSWLGAEPLRSIKTLETINGQPAATFWKQVDGQAADFEKFRKFVALLPAADQLKEVTARLKTQNPGFAAMPTSTIDQGTGTVKEFAFPTEHIIDLSPVRAFPRLQSLNLQSDLGKSKLVDLTPLQGMKLTSLILQYCEKAGDLTPLQGMPLTLLHVAECSQVRDLTPLRGMPLTKLYLGHNPVPDLTPLQGMKLTTFSLNYSPVRDLTPLRGMPLTTLDLSGYTEVLDFALLQGMPLTYLALGNCGQLRDLTPLRGMKLTSLGVNGCTQVRDLTPLKGMKLQTLYVSETAVEDLTPLAGMPLEELWFTPKNITRGIEVIQRITTLKRIDGVQPAEFWKKYKAGEFGK